MRSKSILLLLVALGCGTVAAVAVSQTLLDRNSKSAGEPSVEILVATQEIKTASLISADRVKLEKWPKSKLPEGAMIELSQVEGKYARQGIFPGEPIIAAKLADSNSSLSTQIPAGHTLFNIKYDNNYIKPGDLVDISGVFKDAKTKKTEVIPVVRNIQVFAINGINDRDHENKGGKDTEFQLLIRQDQHQALTLANNLGKLELNLRPLGANGEVKDQSDNGDSFLTWARENSAQAEPPAEEPAPSPKLVAAPAAPPIEEKPKKNEILIVTPQGVKRYEYGGPNEVPKEVTEEVATKAPAGAYPTNPWGSYSGYGGYTPTYPNTSNTAPAQDSNGSNANPGNEASVGQPQPVQPENTPKQGRSSTTN